MHKIFLILFLGIPFLTEAQITHKQTIFPTQSTFAWGRHVTTDLDGNVYTLSAFIDTAWLDSAGIKLPFVSHGQIDLLLSSFTCDGKFRWANVLGGASNEELKYMNGGLCVSDSGMVYMSVSLNGNAYIGSNGESELATSGKGNEDIILVKYNSMGRLLWHLRSGSIGNDYGGGLALDQKGNIWQTGCYYGNATFYSTDGNHKLLSSAGASDIFLVKYAPNGTLLATQTAGGPLEDFGHTVYVDIAQNVLVAGNFSIGGAGYAAFGNINIINQDGTGAFAAKMGFQGKWSWVVTMGENGNEAMSRMIEMPDHSFLVAGIFDLQTEPVSSAGGKKITLTSKGREDVAFIKVSEQGSILDAWNEGSQGFDNIAGLTYTPEHDIVWTLIFSDSIRHRGNMYNGRRGAESMIIQMDTTGNWKNTTLFSGRYAEVGTESFLAQDGSYWVAGFTESDSFYIAQDTFLSPAYRNHVFMQYHVSKVPIKAARAELNCSGNDSILLTIEGISSPMGKIVWTLNQQTLADTISSIYAKKPGDYQCVYKGFCRADTMSIRITLEKGLKNLLGNDRVICGSEEILKADPDAVAVLWPNGSSSKMYSVQKSGTYILWQMNAKGCTTRDTVRLTFEKANAQFMGKFKSGNEWEFTALDTLQYQYFWDLGQGWTMRTYKLSTSISASPPFTVRCMVKTQGNCVDSVSNTYYGAEATQINIKSIHYYPVPASDFINIQGEAFKVITIMDGLGRIIDVVKLNEFGNAIISVENWATGLFYIVMENAVSGKFNVMHP